MADHSATSRKPLTLVERKQLAARTRIVEAADALFAERGFDGVSVSDIAERAEVGRTTFFRHFKDKTEVVFAKEQAMFDAITDAASEVQPAHLRVQSLAEALNALEPLVIRLCQYATDDPAAYRRHIRLLEAHEELRAREALKRQVIAEEFAKVLLAQGASFEIATMASQFALACYSAGNILSTTPGDLIAKTREAFLGARTTNIVR